MAKKHLKVKGAGKIVNNEVIPFTKQVSSMLGAGMTIVASIQTLEEQAENPEFKKVLTHIKEVLECGEPMSVALDDYPDLFDEMYVNMVRAGESSGQFAAVLKRLAIIIQSGARLKKKVKSAMTYPTVIVSIALLMSAGLIQFVVPIFAEMFGGFGKDLPFLTQMLVDISEFVKGWWYIIAPIIFVALGTFKKWAKTPAGRLKVDEWKIKLPVFGQLILKSSIGRFCRLLAQMMSSGVPILESLRVVAGSLGNHVLEKSILDARSEVEQGNQLNTSLEGKPYLPILMVRMIAAGEKAGKIEDMLESIADTYDEEVETMLGTLTSLMEPFLMVFLGAIIGTIVMAMFMPIFNLGSLSS